MNNVRELILSLIVVVLVFIFGIKQLVGIIVECKDNFSNKSQKQSVVEDLRIKSETIDQANQRLEQQKDILKPFYKQDFAQNDSIAAFGGMFEDLVDYIKMEGLMLRSIEYNINPPTDLIFKNFASSYNVCEVKLFLVGTYPQLQRLFRDVEAYPYYINVAQINIVPYEANKNYLLINLSINLYSKK